MKQQFLQKDLHQINNFSFSNTVTKPQVSISRKTQKISNKKPISCGKQEQICCPSRRTVKNSIHTYGGNSLSQSTTLQPGRTNVVRNVSILQKLVTDDHLIKYTTDSSQIKRTDVELMYSRIDAKDDKKQVKNITKKVQTNGFSLLIKKQDMINEEFDLTEIRQFQGISTRRKQKLNYEYLKQKILIEASVRKIQRAWRNYRTKKLVNCYSSQLSSRFLKTQLITSARSQTRSLNLIKQKTMFKSNDLYLNNGEIIEGFKDKVVNDVENEECSSDDEEFERQQGRKGIKFLEERPFSKKYVASTGKVEKKFFETEVIKRQEKPVRPMSPKISPKLTNGQVSQNIVAEKKQIAIQPNQRLKKQAAIQFSTLPVGNQSEIQQKLKKFQQQEIRKWQSILDSIKKGKNIEVLLQKSQRYKKQLQSNLNKQKNLNSVINRSRASPILFRQQSSKSSLASNKPISKNQIQKQSNILESVILNNSQESSKDGIMVSQTQKIPRLSSPQNLRSHEDESLNETAEKRKEKILFFENEILKIDNEEYSDTSSIQSFDQVVNKKEQFDELQQREREENIKLRKKLQLFNTHFLDISSADQGLTDRSLKGLKGNSTDERRNSINKRFNSNKEQTTIVPIQKQPLISHQSIEQPSSEQTRQNRRPDVVLPQNQSINAAKQPINKIHELISRKIQYPEEQEEYASSEDSSLQYQDKHQTYAPNKFVSPQSNYIDEMSDQSMSSEGIVDFMGHEKHFENDFIYGEPVMTHRQRRLQVPQLRLDTLPKKFPDSIKKMKEQIMSKNVNQQEQTFLNPKYQTSNSIYNEFFQTNKKQQTKNDSIIDEILVVAIPKPVPSIPKMDIKDVMKICSYLQEQLVYEGLLQFSDSGKIVQSIKGLFDNFKKQKKKLKPEGICTNLESIKDYLENFVGFVFQNKLTQQIIKFLWTPSGPKAIDLLKYLRKDTDYDNDQNEYIMSIEIFEKHWKYANSNIYFDKKYNDDKTEQQRVSYLKSLTRVYFRSIFDAFNESLQFQRSYGMMGKPYPWSTKVTKESKKELKLAFQQAYRRILKISVVYYGVHFDDKAHLFGQDEIKQLQEERLLTLLMMELEEDQYKWNFIEDQLAQVKYDVGLMIEQAILDEVLKQLEVLVKRQLPN